MVPNRVPGTAAAPMVPNRVPGARGRSNTTDPLVVFTVTACLLRDPWSAVGVLTTR
jgi:hypothetical protein